MLHHEVENIISDWKEGDELAGQAITDLFYEKGMRPSAWCEYVLLRTQSVWNSDTTNRRHKYAYNMCLCLLSDRLSQFWDLWQQSGEFVFCLNPDLQSSVAIKNQRLDPINYKPDFALQWRSVWNLDAMLVCWPLPGDADFTTLEALHFFGMQPPAGVWL